MIEKNIFINIKKISKRGLILPSIFILLIVILFCTISFDDIFLPPSIKTTKNVDTLYKQDTEYIEYNIEKLYYTNYDYVVNNKILGYYYYSIVDSKCTFVLLSAKTIESPKEVLTDYKGKAKLTPPDSIHKQMLTLLAKDINWTVEGITSASSVVIVNELAYHEFGYFLLLITIMIIFAISIYLIIIHIIFYNHPELYPTCLKLKKYGDVFVLVEKVEHELQNNVVIKSGNTYITENFFIDISYFSLIIVPIEQIVWAYEHTKWRKFLWVKLKLSYTLNIVAKNKVKVISHENTKDNIDFMLDLIHRKHPLILIGFSKENKEKAKKLY